MARYGQRPENALKRANEFIEVGKPTRALDTLQEVFRNKKWTHNWSESVLEPIMFKYLDLCVELKKSHIAKEGLFQYRNLFQSVNVGSLENVIRGYLHMAEEKTENAREQSAQAVIDIDDLDNLTTPESILLSAVSGEDAQDRSDRTILTPWVKFLWESYCQCLELLRTNAHVENLYHDIARMAFQFCLKYNRKTEFRKLCDKLRKHLDDICKLPPQVANVSMSKPETQQLNLETRLHQLDFAIQMELWQEAYKAIEDIHNLMNMSKKMPVPKTMANYYQKLAMVFWKAGNYLFHAAALFKLFQLSKEMKKNITQNELQRMACCVLLATLSIPLPSAHPEFDRFIETDKSPLEKAQRLSVLLGLFQPPTRASLLKDLVRVNVVALATPQLQDLYKWLEVEFHPLLLCNRVNSVIQSIRDEENILLLQYIKPLQDVTLVRLIRQVAQVYQTIELDRLIELSKFATPFHIERLLVDCVRYNDMQIRIDHGKRCIHFGMDLSESQREDKPEGPTLQVMPSEQVRNQLVNMSTILHQAINIINPSKKKVERDRLRSIMVQNYHENKVREHQKILARHKIIEDRKEYIERLNTVREEEEQRRLEELQRQQALAEQKRLEEERAEKERKRQLNEIQQIKDRHLKEKLQQISQTGHGQKILKKLDEDDIKKLDADQIAAKEAEELQKERREIQAKLKSQEKKVDYFERAKRLEEIPLLQQSLQVRQVKDQQFWEQQEEERIAAAIQERQIAVTTKERLMRMKPDKEAFLEKLKKERNIVYEDKLNNFMEELEKERAKRLLARKQKRKEDRRTQWYKEKEEEEERQRAEQRRKEEEERQRLEEIARKEREEKERVEREEKEKKDKEREEMLQRSLAKQLAKDLEIEQRMMEEKEKYSSQKKDDKVWRSKATQDKVDRGLTRSDKPESAEGERTEVSWRRDKQDKDRGEDKKPEPWKSKPRPTDQDSGNVWRSARIERDENTRADDRDVKDDRGGSRMDRRDNRPMTRGSDTSSYDRFSSNDTNRSYMGRRRTDDDRKERREDGEDNTTEAGGQKEERGGGSWRSDDKKEEPRGAWRPKIRQPNQQNDEGEKKERDMGSWRAAPFSKNDDEATPSLYRPVMRRQQEGSRDGPREGPRDWNRSRDGQRNEQRKDTDSGESWRRDVKKDEPIKRGGGDIKKTAPLQREKVQEQPPAQSQAEVDEGWCQVLKKR